MYSSFSKDINQSGDIWLMDCDLILGKYKNIDSESQGSLLIGYVTINNKNKRCKKTKIKDIY